MFIEVTRFGGRRTVRVAAAAIAWLDDVEGGTAIHLVGGETLRVNDDRADIEYRAQETLSMLMKPPGSPIEARMASPTPVPAAAMLPTAQANQSPSRHDQRRARR